MQKEIMIKEFKAMVDEVSTGINPILIFKKLKKYNLSRIELMIVDSAIKDMPLENLYKTLLISESDYNEMIKNLTFKLIDLYHNESQQN